MSKTNAIFESAAVDIPNISGHDMSHEHLTSMMFGALTPTLCMELMPDSTVDAGVLSNVALPPFAAKFNGKLDLKTECYFVPLRTVWGGWKDFAAQKNQTIFGANVPNSVPYMDLHDFANLEATTSHVPVNYTFLQQLGYDVTGANYGIQYDHANIFPLLCYQRIWADWYRDPRLQQNPFSEGDVYEVLQEVASDMSDVSDKLWRSPWYKHEYKISPKGNTLTSVMADFQSVFVPRPRLWAKDYFTTAIPSPVQQGIEQRIAVSGNTITISSIRSANALMRYAEKLAAVGDRYEDIEAATYGVRPSDAVLDRPLLLGSSSKPLYTTGVKITNDPALEVGTQTSPYVNQYGAETGKIEATDGLSICNNFTTTERGYLFVIQSVVPHAYYNNVVNKEVFHLNFTDFGNPAFANLGRVPVRTRELDINTALNSIFGYVDRYSEYKFRNDRVTGQMCRGKYLDVFALKRDTANVSSIGSDFLEMKPTCMDGVLAYAPTIRTFKQPIVYVDVDTDSATFQYNAGEPCQFIDQPEREFELDTYFDMRVTNTLPVFTIPSLEGPKGNTRFVPRSGVRM